MCSRCLLLAIIIFFLGIPLLADDEVKQDTVVEKGHNAPGWEDRFTQKKEKDKDKKDQEKEQKKELKDQKKEMKKDHKREREEEKKEHKKEMKKNCLRNHYS